MHVKKFGIRFDASRFVSYGLLNLDSEVTGIIPARRNSPLKNLPTTKRMKFGKRVRSLASPEWAADYVDYKALKREIKLVFSEGSGFDDADKRMKWFQSLLESEMQKLNEAHARILDELVNLELKPLQQTLGTRWVLPHATARALLLDVLQLSHKVDAFRRFVVLNSLALVKIAKKFDKTANADPASILTSQLKKQVLENLNYQPFYDATSLDALCDETASLTDRVMLCVLPDGNFRLGPRALTCPICLSADVQAPITLSCAHTFCWSCLSRATLHRFRSCPLCRRAQSIDPRDYEIDGLVKRFKRVYEFIEQGLNSTPLVTSPMRQILAEAFDVGNAYLRGIEDQYAALTPSPLESHNIVIPDVPAVQKQVEEAKKQVFDIGDIVEILHGEHWLAGLVLQRNEESGADDTYAVLWWVQDKSQRFSQRTPRHRLREPQKIPVPPAMYGYAVDAWRTAASWALEPFRRL